MTHLGRWLSALVDGELDPAERDHVLNHLAGCDACRMEANALRALKRRMTALGDTSADAAVVHRLIDLARSDSLAAGGQPFASAARRPVVRQFVARQSAAGSARLAWLGLKIATGAAGAVFLAVGLAAFLLGVPSAAPQPQVTPPLPAYWLEHVHDMGQAPTMPTASGQPSSVGSRPGTGALARSAVKPATKPTGTKLAATKASVGKKRAGKKRHAETGQVHATRSLVLTR